MRWINTIAFLLTVFIAKNAAAQLPYFQSFKDTVAPNLVIAGSAKLTARSVDTPGKGYLRLTDTTINLVGCVYGADSFPSAYGISATFEFFTYTKSGSTPADGFSFFLYDAAANAFRAGGTGGSLGYAQKNTTPGLGKGYIGVGIDEFGNFSVQSDGNKSGGTTSKVSPAVVIRGPGNGATSSDYPYITGVQTNSGTHFTPFQAFTQRYPDSTTANYRRVKIIMKPATSPAVGFRVTVIMFKGAATAPLPDTLISDYSYPYTPPAKLKYGFIASTGSVFAFHEMRNMRIEAYDTGSLLPPTLRNDTAAVCSGNIRTIDIAANDFSNNTGGSINRGSIDLDTATTGIQTSYTDAGKGSYTVDSSGIVTFTPIGSYTGSSGIYYTAKDNYGKAAARAGFIYVTVASGSAFTLAVTDPAGICGTGTVSITAAAVTAGSTSGTTFSYYNNLSDALAPANSISTAAASAISTAGTYYIRGVNGVCYTAKPVNVVISANPSTASVSPAKFSLCNSSTSPITLVGNTPAVGAGTWSQVTGPASANIFLPMSSTTSAQIPSATGIYVIRWSIVNGVCPASTADDSITVSSPPTTANAGGNHNMCNSATYTLSGNTPSVGTGAWTILYKTASSTPTFSSTTNPTATVSGLAAGNTYVFQWKTSNGACTSTSNDTLRDYASPSTASTSGSQVLIAANSTTVTGNTPSVGTGAWSQVSGASATIATPSQPSTTISGLSAPNTYVFRWSISNGVCTPSVSDLSIIVAVPTPLRLLSFEGRRSGNRSLLSWRTADEQGCDHFEIERSPDGRSFGDVGHMAAKGSVGENRYDYTDDFAASQSGRLFYRLKEVDADKSVYYSPVVVLSDAGADGIGVSPNPFKDRLVISLPQDAVISMYDATGRMVRSLKAAPAVGPAEWSGLDDLHPGVYLLRILGADGTSRAVRVVKE